LQQQYQTLDREVKLIKSLLEKATKNFKAVKKQLKNELKLNEVPKVKEEKGK